MFAFIHAHTKGAVVQAKASVQQQCDAGDRKADQDASVAQHAADMLTLAQLRAQLREAQIAAAKAEASSKVAQARADRLTASLKALSGSVKSVKAWADTPLPPELQQAIWENQ